MADVSTVLNWVPRTPFYYGWVFLGITALGAFVTTSVAGVALGDSPSDLPPENCTNWSESVR
jgi:hypothetical protein